MDELPDFEDTELSTTMCKAEILYFLKRLGEDIVILALLTLPLLRRKK